MQSIKPEIIVNNILNAMVNTLTTDQSETLKNILFINLHGYTIQAESTEIIPINVDTNETKIKMFVLSKKTINRQDNTLKQYVNEIRNLITFLGKNIEDITTMDIRYYCGYMREKRKIKMSTMQTRLHYLNSFWEFLVSEELVHNNPVRKIGLIKVEKTIKKPFTTDEMESLRNNCKNIRDRALVEFLYSTGVRVSELVSLNISDINITKQELIVFGKGCKERKSYLTDAAKYYLQPYLESRKEPYNSDAPLFVTLDRTHKRLTVAGVQYMLRQLGKRAGVKNTHPHRFRRTIATDLLNRSMRIEEVKEFLGHEKIDTTLLYCTISQESVRSSHKKYA